MAEPTPRVARASRPRVVAALAGALLAAPTFAPTPAYAQKLYFTELDAQRVYRSDRDGSSVEDLGPTSAPLGLVLDDTAGLRYWIVRTVYGGPTNGIVRSGLEPGSPVEVIADQSDGLLAPRALALDHVNGLLYWTDNGAPPSVPARIQRCEVSDCRGTITTLIASDLTDPVALALDVGAGKIYWTEHTNDRVSAPTSTAAGAAPWPTPASTAQRGSPSTSRVTRSTGPRPTAADPARRPLTRHRRETVVSRVPSSLDLVGVRVDVAPGRVYAVDYTTDKLWRTSVELPGPPLDLLYQGLDGPWDLALDRAPCSVPLDLAQGQWAQLGLPCDPGAAATVAQVFATSAAPERGLGTVSSGTRWTLTTTNSAPGKPCARATATGSGPCSPASP